MDEYASEGLETYTNQIMAFLKVTYSKLEREADPNKKNKKGNFVPQNNLWIEKVYLSQIIMKCKNPISFDKIKYPKWSRHIFLSFF